MTNSSPILPGIGDLAVGRYRIIRELGRGGYGVVFLARQEAINRDVAIKFLLPDIASDPTEVERFRREVFHASGLSNPHTITLYDYGRSPAGLFYVVMEYLRGDTLRDRLSRRGPLSVHTARQLLEELLLSLEEAHNRDLVHRDLKPENIFLCDADDDSFHTKILDFGLSKFIGDPRSTLYRGPSLTAEGEICGTPQYMSPEHAYGEDVGPSGDIYSLGLLIYEALVGHPAFEGPSPLDILLKQVKEPTPPLPASLATTHLASFITRATEKEADQRFPNAGDALRWLYQHPESPSSPPLRPPTKPAFSPAEVRPNTTPVESTPVESTPTISNRRGALEQLELRIAQAPLVGRRRSLARLDAWFSQARIQGGCFVLTGDTGVGKSALLRLWSSRLSAQYPLQLLSGTHTRDAAPLSALRQAFSSLYADDSSAQERTSLLNVTQVQTLVEIFHRSASPSIDDEPNDPVPFLLDTLRDLSRQEPLLLILEDLHNADPITRRLVDQILDHLHDAPLPIALVVSLRSDSDLNPWRRTSHKTLVHWPLQPLADADLADLLGRLLKTSDPLRQSILKLSAGNPALMLHLARYLLDSDLIVYRQESNHWDLANPSAPIEKLVPLDLQQLIIERANRHLQRSPNEPSLRTILHRAVLLGDQFDSDLLQRCLRKEGLEALADRCPDLLEELVTSGLIQRRDTPGRRRYVFARTLHRASLVRMVESIDDWRNFHLLVAQTLIARGDDPDFDQRDATIAEHYERARDLKRALPWWMRAAQVAESQHQYRQAIEMLRRAEAYLQSQRDIDAALASELRLQQGRLFRQLGEFGPAEDALLEAIGHARRSGDAPRHAHAAGLLADVVLLQGRLNEAATLLDEASNLYHVLDDPAGKRRTRLARADLAIFRGQYTQARALFLALRANIDHDRGVDEYTEIRCLIGLARCDFTAGNLPRAMTTINQAISAADHAQDHRALAAALIEAAQISLHTSGFEASESLAHQSLTLARRNHDPLAEANAHLILGLALRRSTNLDRARFHVDRARELHESTGHIYGILKDILLSAEIYWLQGDPKRALFLAEDTARLHRDLGDQHGWTLSTLFEALFLIELDRAPQAQTLLKGLLSDGDRESLGFYEPQALFYLAMTLEARGDVDEAITTYLEAQTLATAMGRRELVSLIAISIAKLKLICGDIDSARREIPKALQEAEHLGHAYANIFALVGAALMARIDGDAVALRRHMTRLRPYLGTPNAPDMHLPSHLASMQRLLRSTPKSPRHAIVSAAIQDILDGLNPPKGQ